MLPDINPDDRKDMEKWVLVRSSRQFQAVGGGVESKPAPARSLNSKRRLIELLLQIVEAAKIAFDGLLERSILQDPACSFLYFSRRSKVLPEQRVVDMSSAIEFECSLKCDALLRSGCACIGGLCRIQSIDVSLVVLLVMKLHDLARDIRLECIIGVREVRESVGHGNEVVVGL